MKKLLIISIVTVSASLFKSALAQSNHHNKIMAGFIYDMVKYTRWDQVNDVTNLCYFGFDDITYHINKIHQQKDLKIRNLNIIENVKTHNLENCNIIYISINQEPRIHSIFEAIKNKKIITVSNIEGFANKGGVFEIYLNRSKNIGAYVNKEKLKECNVSLGYQILGFLR